MGNKGPPGVLQTFPSLDEGPDAGFRHTLQDACSADLSAVYARCTYVVLAADYQSLQPNPEPDTG